MWAPAGKGTECSFHLWLLKQTWSTGHATPKPGEAITRAGYVHVCLKNSNCQELLTIPSGLQGQEQSSPRETQPPAPDHIFSTSQRGRGRARAALLVCSNTTGMKKKNSLLRLPDLGEEVGGKGAAAAGARRARLGGWGGREPRTRGWETLPSPPLSLSLSRTRPII